MIEDAVSKAGFQVKVHFVQGNDRYSAIAVRKYVNSLWICLLSYYYTNLVLWEFSLSTNQSFWKELFIQWFINIIKLYRLLIWALLLVVKLLLKLLLFNFLLSSSLIWDGTRHIEPCCTTALTPIWMLPSKVKPSQNIWDNNTHKTWFKAGCKEIF